MHLDDGIVRQVHESIGLPGPAAGTRIVVAMSGGVDSSVVTGLLKHMGKSAIVRGLPSGPMT